MPRVPGYRTQLPPKYICPCIPKRPSNANFFSNARHCLAHLAVVWAVRRKGWEVPALLVFPRIELIIGTSAVPGATRASVVLISTGHPGGIVLGLLVLLSFPLAILAFVFTTLRRGILAKGSVVRWVPNTDKPTVGGCKLNSFV